LFALVDCGADDTARSKRSTDPTEEADLQSDGGRSGTPGSASPSAPHEDPIVTFMFDGGRSLRARVREKEAQGASLFVSIFPSNDGDDRAVDCAALSRGQRGIDVGSAPSAGAARVADVPVDASLFAGRLDGISRTTIQGCLLGPQGQIVTKVSTSLMNAWDSDDASVAANPRVFHGVEAYANGCIDELGELPMFKDGADFDCLRDPGMVVVPITATADNGVVTSIANASAWPLGSAQLDATQVCDRPAWLDYGDGLPCAPFTRVGRYTNSKGSDFVVICRRTDVRDPMDPNFDVMGVVGQNPETGKTCWFNKRAGVTDMSRIPPPNTPTADKFWMDSGDIRDQACPKCHDSDPWLHTPWIDQVADAQGRPIVPRIGRDKGYTLSTKYSIFARESFTVGGPTSASDWRQPQHLTNIGSCGSCHRIGAASTLSTWTARAVGDPSDQDFQDSFITNAFRTPEKLHWMPTTPFSAADNASVQAIFNCDPSTCRVEDTPH
jgi:hypothetical protein